MVIGLVMYLENDPGFLTAVEICCRATQKSVKITTAQ